MEGPAFEGASRRQDAGDLKQGFRMRETHYNRNRFGSSYRVELSGDAGGIIRIFDGQRRISEAEGVSWQAPSEKLKAMRGFVRGFCANAAILF